MDSLIKIKDLDVRVGSTSILDLNGKTINISKGDVVGIIGENGAGKTTLFNCIIGRIQYTGCIKKSFSVNELGIQFQVNSYNKLMKVYELIQIVTKKVKFDNKISNELEQFELNDLLKKRIGELSVGELQRITLFLVLYLQPNVLLFDELTTGLDYKKRIELLGLVKEYCKNKTVLTITHYFEEISDWANKLLILHKGRLVFYGTINELEELHSHYSIIKVSKKFRHDINEICCNNISLIDLNEQNIGIVVSDKKQHNILIEKLSQRCVQFQVELKGIYSLYMLAIASIKGECET